MIKGVLRGLERQVRMVGWACHVALGEGSGRSEKGYEGETMDGGWASQVDLGGGQEKGSWAVIGYCHFLSSL